MAQVPNIKRHLNSDEIFNKINELFISLDSHDVKRQNPHIDKVFERLIQLMKQQSLLFEKTYKRIAWSGSFYKKTRITKPEEYDVNFVISLPIKERDLKLSSDCSGFVKIRTTWTERDFRNLNMDPKAYREMNSFIDNSYLNQEKFRTWIEGIFSKVAYKTSGSNLIKLDDYPPIRLKKSGPAFTLQLQILSRTVDIDVVPVLAFSARNPPPRCSGVSVLQIARYENTYWYAVPKPLTHNRREFDTPQYYWRLSYYEFEKYIISSHEYGRIKPIIRHLKKFRDTMGWKTIASYYLEMLCFQYLEIFNISNRVSLTFLFFEMLQHLHTAFCKHEIKYYWDENLNLLEHIGYCQMQNMQGRLCRVIKSIEKNIENDPYAIAACILTSSELITLRLSNQSITPSLSIISERKLESEPESSRQWGCMIV